MSKAAVRADLGQSLDVLRALTAKVSLETNGKSDSGGGNTSSTVTIDLQGLVDDSAAIVGYETTSNTRASSGARGQVADEGLALGLAHGAGAGSVVAASCSVSSVASAVVLPALAVSAVSTLSSSSSSSASIALRMTARSPSRRTSTPESSWRARSSAHAIGVRRSTSSMTS